MRFDTPITMTGPSRRPAQLLGDQTYDGHVSVHDDATAAKLGLRGAPIEGPTHFSQFDPFGIALFGQRWFESGCLSVHFQNMVVEGEEARATAELTQAGVAIGAVKADGTPVLAGTMSIGPDHATTELYARLAALRDPGELFIIDRVEVGARQDDEIPSVIDFESPNGDLYPFSLQRKLDTITEPHSWYQRGANTPWGRPVLPFEMLSVLTNKNGPRWPVRTPSLGLFLDLEVKMLAGPVSPDVPYLIRREVIARGQSRRVESYWTRSVVVDLENGQQVCAVTLHQGVFKDSYPLYPSGASGPSGQASS
jgi:hypothetical protein